MQRLAVVGLVALAGVLAFLSVGCVDEAKYNAVLLRNREQDKLLQEKEAQMATLTERVNALQAQKADAQRMLQEKEDHLASVMRERDTIRKAFDDLKDAYVKIAGKMAIVPSGTGLPEKTVLEIKQLAEQYPGVFEFDEATGRLRFAADITFDSGSNVVKPDARTAITKLGGILSADVAKNIKVTIKGHTDSDPVKKPATIALLKELGKPSSNQGLSEARAESVAQILKAGGVEGGRVVTQGVGDSQPVVTGNTAEAKAKQRCVEIYLQ
jgi:flagellar motor protein MotB